MTETTWTDRSQDTEWLRRNFLARGAEIERLENRLAHIESKTLYRDESMPVTAFRWVKETAGTFFDCIEEFEPGNVFYNWYEAPDYRPNEDECTLAIIDPPEES